MAVTSVYNAKSSILKNHAAKADYVIFYPQSNQVVKSSQPDQPSIRLDKQKASIMISKLKINFVLLKI